MKRFLINVYKRKFVRKRLYNFHSKLFNVSLWGLGVLNSENDNWSGEDHFICHLADYGYTNQFIVFDIGANVGDYSNKIKSLYPQADIIAFEPSIKTFSKLEQHAQQFGYRAFNLGLSNVEGTAPLYNHPTGTDSLHASLYREVIEEIHDHDAATETIMLTTLDKFILEHNIEGKIFLKIDTEGNEFKILQGATESIKKGCIQIIQFEFNEMNVISKVFLRDFMAFLPQFDFYRMLPDGLVPITAHSTFLREIFAFQNIVAILRYE